MIIRGTRVPLAVIACGFCVVFFIQQLRGYQAGKSLNLLELREFQRHGEENRLSYRKTLVTAKMPSAVNSGQHGNSFQIDISETVNDQQKDPQIVLIFAYMRGGSSFIGGILENNPDVFYWYEPLWDVYNAMTSSTLWQFPLHVVLDQNEELRNITEYERKFIRKSMRSIFTCQFVQAPLELFTSWTLGKSPLMAGEYMRCLNKHGGLDTASSSCQKPLRTQCPNRASTSLNNNCHKFMELSRIRYDVNMSSFPSVKQHKECMKRVRIAQNQCVHLVENQCEARPIKAAKVLRTRMAVMEDLIAEFPNVKIIHELRDPRGTLVSRRKDARLYVQDITKEASLLCTKMLDDIKTRIYLEEKYPNVFLTTRYEDLAIQPLETTVKLYEHIDIPLSTVVKKWVEQTTNASSDGSGFQLVRKNATATAVAWRERLSVEDKEKIDEVCKDVYEVAGYDV